MTIQLHQDTLSQLQLIQWGKTPSLPDDSKGAERLRRMEAQGLIELEKESFGPLCFLRPRLTELGRKALEEGTPL